MGVKVFRLPYTELESEKKETETKHQKLNNLLK